MGVGGEVVCADEFIGEDRCFMRGNGARGGIGCGRVVGGWKRCGRGG